MDRTPQTEGGEPVTRGISNHAPDAREVPNLISEKQLTVDQAYTLWAETYDNVPNPLLALEERCLAPMLPSLDDKTVLDLGCGTGRLLKLLSSSAAAWYLGVDMSSAMLRRSAPKLHIPGCLLRADCVNLPLSSHIADVVIGSFLLGYINVRDLAAEIARVSRGATDLFLSEFHPEACALGWKRSFRSGAQVIELPTNRCAPQDVEQAFRLHGFDLARKVEPSFGEPEREIFVTAGKSGVFEASSGTPAIFICHLRRTDRAI
jgi:ubiquinone/menaquinone biosynthesis C-methylase UbiE